MIHALRSALLNERVCICAGKQTVEKRDVFGRPDLAESPLASKWHPISKKEACNIKYEHLFEPIKVGSIELRNRFIVPSMGTALASAMEGDPDERLVRYWGARAKGGFALCIIEYAYVNQVGKGENPATLLFQKQGLQKNNVKVLANCQVAEIGEVVTAEIDGVAESLGSFDHIVLAAGITPYNPLQEALADSKAEVVVIGDARDARRALEAIFEGAMYALDI